MSCCLSGSREMEHGAAGNKRFTSKGWDGPGKHHRLFGYLEAQRGSGAAAENHQTDLERAL